MDEHILKKLVKDWKIGKLTDFSAMTALSIIVDPQEPSKEAMEWAKKWAKDCMEKEVKTNYWKRQGIDSSSLNPITGNLRL